MLLCRISPVNRVEHVAVRDGRVYYLGVHYMGHDLHASVYDVFSGRLLAYTCVARNIRQLWASPGLETLVVSAGSMTRVHRLQDVQYTTTSLVLPRFRTCCVADNGAWVAILNSDGIVMLYDVDSGRQRRITTAHDGVLASSPDSSLVCGQTSGSYVCVWPVCPGNVQPCRLLESTYSMCTRGSLLPKHVGCCTTPGADCWTYSMHRRESLFRPPQYVVSCRVLDTQTVVIVAQTTSHCISYSGSFYSPSKSTMDGIYGLLAIHWLDNRHPTVTRVVEGGSVPEPVLLQDAAVLPLADWVEVWCLGTGTCRARWAGSGFCFGLGVIAADGVILTRHPRGVFKSRLMPLLPPAVMLLAAACRRRGGCSGRGGYVPPEVWCAALRPLGAVHYPHPATHEPT